MSRTPGFKGIRHALKLAMLSEKHQISAERIAEIDEAARLTRRQILKHSLEAAAVAPFLGLASCMGKQSHTDAYNNVIPLRTPANNDEIVIIGAGTAGLTAAYRLAQQGIGCHIYEASNRTGGRMFTQHNFNEQNMFCERGGELVDTDHEELIALCKELGMTTPSLVETDKSLAKELYFINGKVYTQKDLLEGFKPLAKHIAADLKVIYNGKDAEVPTYQEPYKARVFDQMSLRQYLESKRNLVEQWVIDLIDVTYTGEYGQETDKQSAINLLCMIGTETKEEVRLLGASDECMRIEGGSGALPDKLTEKIKKSTPISYEHQLVKVRDNGQQIILTFNNNGKTVEVTASQVICAIPFTILRNVEGINELDFSPRKKKAIRELGYGANAKLMMGFKSRYWRNDHHHKSNGLVYSNTVSQEFWETSRKQNGSHGIITSFVGGKSGMTLKPERLKNALNDFGRIFPGAQAQHDGHTVFQHWPSVPYVKGSYICPAPGQYTELIGATGETELKGRFLFAGEHTSVEFGGFMNGAVSSGNKAAKEIVDQRKEQPAAKAQ